MGWGRKKKDGKADTARYMNTHILYIRRTDTTPNMFQHGNTLVRNEDMIYQDWYGRPRVSCMDPWPEPN